MPASALWGCVDDVSGARVSAVKHDEEIETAGLAMAFFKSQLRSTQRLGNTKLRRPEENAPLSFSPPRFWETVGCVQTGVARVRGASGSRVRGGRQDSRGRTLKK